MAIPLVVVLLWALPHSLGIRQPFIETLAAWLMLAAVAVIGVLLRRQHREMVRAVRRLSAFAETGDDLWWELDPQGVVTFMAPNVEDYLGYAPDEVIGHHSDLILAPPERGRVAALLAASAARGTGWTDQAYRFLARDGTEVPVLSTGVAHVGADGQVKGFTGTVRRADRDPGTERLREKKRRRITDVLERRRALHTVFQPIADVSTGEVIGAEALSRFEEGPPNRWFADAAEVGLGPQLELFAAEQALREAHHLPPHLYVSINVSPATLCTGRLQALVLAADCAPSRLIVEITEHISVEDYEPLAGCVEDLRKLGLRLAVDDAGAGYASFRHILGLGPDYIKLDRALISGMDTDPARRALVSAVVTFGRDVGAVVVAEGIETPAELRTARLLEVDAAQGFLIGRPAPAGPGWATRS